MMFNPSTQSLFTDDLRLVKEVHCPIKATWSQLSATQDAAARQCDACDSTVTDSATLTDDQAIALIEANPNVTSIRGVDPRTGGETVLWSR